MKTLVLIFTIFFLNLVLSPLYSQDDCKVLVPEISEKYEGQCRKGYAHGKGHAWGIDQYEGQFRRGLPHGLGKYTWANGNVYEGRWMEGQRHGKGTYSFMKDAEKHVLSGHWQNDEFRGRKKVPAYTRGHILNVERYNIRRTGDGNMILVIVHEQGRINPLPRNYIFRINTGSSIRVGLASGYEGVSFPAEVRITYNMPDKLQQGSVLRVRFEVTINEPGTWEIKLYH